MTPSSAAPREPLTDRDAQLLRSIRDRAPADAARLLCRQPEDQIARLLAALPAQDRGRVLGALPADLRHRLDTASGGSVSSEEPAIPDATEHTVGA